MLVAQLSDPHITQPESLIAQFVSGEQRLAAALEQLATLPRRPDALVLTGDLVDKGQPDEYARLRAVLDPCPIPWFVLPGNHDEREAFRAAFADRHEIPERGHLSWVVDDLPLRLVGLDTTLTGRDDGAFDEERRAWLGATLAEEPARPTILFLHHPPFSSGIWWMDYGGLHGAAELRALLSDNPQVLRVQCGHVHREVQVAWEHAVVATAPSVAYRSGLGLMPDGPPVLTDEPSTVPLLLWDGTELLAMTTDLTGDWSSVDLRNLIHDWPSYEAAARAGGPMRQERAI
jgi:3',5'-cyclic AMP phosphodiesterase CpdA